MRGDRACGTCVWFEDQSERFRDEFVPADGFCHWRMPATVAKDSTGWGNWHQKGSATVKKVDWCSCWQETKVIVWDQSGHKIDHNKRRRPVKSPRQG